MFHDEARIASQMRHPSIVQIFELGELDGSLFISMELLRGVNLRDLLARLMRRRVELPLPLAIRIACGALEALTYAHEFTDASGRLLNVVHRDVSPQNIIVTYDGGVKLVDFGVAKAEGRLHQTRAGLIKGKFAYMSPEQSSRSRATSPPRRRARASPEGPRPRPTRPGAPRLPWPSAPRSTPAVRGCRPRCSSPWRPARARSRPWRAPSRRPTPTPACSRARRWTRRPRRTWPAPLASVAHARPRCWRSPWRARCSRPARRGCGPPASRASWSRCPRAPRRSQRPAKRPRVPRARPRPCPRRPPPPLPASAPASPSSPPSDLGPASRRGPWTLPSAPRTPSAPIADVPATARPRAA
jgi:serine/threonine protein kinase